MSNKILVTGGTGFLGAYLIKELVERKYAVRAIRRSQQLPFYISKEIFNQVEWVDGDILDVISLEDAMDGVDKVIHSAAIVSFDKKHRANMYHVNVEGTANVVNMSLEKNISRFIHISSVAALGRTAHGGKVDEEKKWDENGVNTHYGKSKYKAELEVWRGFSEGLEGVILNPSTFLGYGDWNTSSCSIFKKVYDGFKWFAPGINGFVDVQDVARATIALMESDITEQRYLINGENWPFKKLQDTIAENMGKPKPSRLTTPFILNAARRLEKLKSMISGHKPLLTRDSIKVALSQTYFDNHKFLQAVPDFSFTPLEQTIEEACRKYLHNLGAVQH
ncbi:NAD-dependent epimerase/dehydratase family protein [Terrimonas alba]|uniref:NAD-dependent epimerase/dehydratase family protein n=1 Tax=Terrimonas alba TaxID=3349636 RepID=UPI0035F35622